MQVQFPKGLPVIRLLRYLTIYKHIYSNNTALLSDTANLSRLLHGGKKAHCVACVACVACSL